MLTILDNKQRPIGILSNDMPKACPYFADSHKEALENFLSTFEFTVPANHPSSSLLEVEGYIIYTDLDRKKHLFQIKEISQSRTGKEVTKTIYCENGAVGELIGHIARPITMNSNTLQQAMEYALQGTEWKLGRVDFVGVRDFEITEHITALEAIHMIAEEFGAEIEYEVIFNGSKIIAKHINVVEQRGKDTGKLFTYEKDIEGIERVEDSRNLITALIGVGKGDEDGNLLTFYNMPQADEVKDDRYEKINDYIADMEAYQRFNRNGQHIFGVFKDENATTPIELYRNTLEKLKELSKPSLTYTVNVVLLEKATGYAHEKVRLGDTVKIQDKTFSPMLVLEARIIEITRSKTDPTADEVVLGDYVPLAITSTMALRQLQNTVFQKEQSWTKAGERISEAIADAKQALIDAESAKGTAQEAEKIAGEASGKVNLLEPRVKTAEEQIEENKKDIADRVQVTVYDQQMLEIEKDLAGKVAVTLYNIDKQTLESEIAKKVAQETYNQKVGQIDSAISGHETRITETEELLSTTMTNVEAMDDRLESAETTVSQTASALESKANVEVVDRIDGRLESAESTISQHAGLIASKVEQADFNTVTGRLDTAESTIKQHAGLIASKVDATIYETDKNGITTRLDTAESTIEQHASMIQSKVEQTEFSAVEDRVSKAESTITQHAGQIQSKVEQTDFNILDGQVNDLDDRIGNAESTITQHANAIATKVEQKTFDSLQGRVDTAESTIKQHANSIASKVEQTDFEELTTRVSNAEELITEDSIINTVTSSETFGNMISEKANAEDLADLATKDELEQAESAMQQYTDEAVGAIDLTPFVEQSQLTQTRDEFEFKLSKANGMNMVKNSIGYADLDFWTNIYANTDTTTVSTPELEVLGFGSGFYFPPSANKGIYQDIHVTAGEAITLSWYLNKLTGASTSAYRFYIQIQEHDGTAWVTKYSHADNSSKITNGYEFDSVTYTPETELVRVRFIAYASVEAYLTGIMMNNGAIPLNWTMANGEVYNTNVRVDMSGIKVLNSEYEGYTQITPEEFAGYAEVDGQMEKVFTLNRDITEMSKAKMEKEITMVPIKIVPLTTGRTGWAFVKEVE